MTLPPDGRQLYFWLPFLFSLSAIGLLFVGTTCHFLKFTSTDDVGNPVTGESGPVSLQFGLWYYQSWKLDDNSTSPVNSTVVVENCALYPPSVTVDGPWGAARGLFLTAIVLGGSLVMLDAFQGCVSTRRNKMLQFGAAGYLVCCIVTGLSLLVLDSGLCTNNALVERANRSNDAIQFGETCGLSTGAKSTIASTALWFAAAAVTRLLHPPGDEGRGGDEEGLRRPLFLEDDVGVL